MPNLAQLAVPLYNLTKKNVKFEWTQEHQSSFEQLKELFGKRIALVPLEQKGLLELYTDASDVACGAVLCQNGQPAEFFSKVFSQTEQRYSTHEREALGMVSSIFYFRTILLGVSFVVWTDHRSLTYWLKRQPVNERHARWMVKL